MEPGVKRITTTKKSNKLVKTLLIVAGVLGLILILVAIYFYAIKPATEREIVADKTCTCYLIDPAVTTDECQDPRKGFNFTQTTVKGNEACPKCTTSKVDTTQLNTATDPKLFVSCPLQNAQDLRCKLMTITDKDGKIITGQIAPGEEITVEATFDKKYINPHFTINSTTEEPDTISEDGLTIKKSFTNFTGTSADIVATADEGSGALINSPLCKRIVSISQQASARVNGLQLTKRIEEKLNKVSKATLKVSNLKESENLNIEFSFGNQKFATLSLVKGLAYDGGKNEITIIEQDLYNSENFSNNLSFAQLDDFVGTVEVTAKLQDGESVLGEATASLTFDEITDETPVDDGEKPGDDIPPEENIEESDFKVTGSANLTCLERVAPNNRVTFTINITNGAESTQTIKSIKNKLPLGFTYVLGSSRINSVSVSDINYLKSTDIGETKELVWASSGGWAISAGQSLSLVFSAEAGPNAITGENRDEVVIEPEQVPVDPNNLRAEIIINVEQACNPVIPEEGEGNEGQTPNIPDTGIFDTTLGRVILGLLIVAIGWYLYTKPFGQIVAKKFVDSEVYKEAEMTSWRIFKPKKYFEESTVKKLGKKK